MFPIHDDAERIHGRPYVNYSLIAINATVFVWEVIVTGFFTNAHVVGEIFSNYGVIPRFLLAGDLESVITSMFIHGGIAHIAGNMVFLFVFGDNIEDRFGRMKYLLIYISWGLVARICPQHLCGQYWKWRDTCRRRFRSYLWCYWRLPGNVSKSKDFYCDSGLFYNYYPYPCFSLHTFLVYFTTHLRTNGVFWWRSCLSCSHRWIYSRHRKWFHLETFISIEYARNEAAVCNEKQY